VRGFDRLDQEVEGALLASVSFQHRVVIPADDEADHVGKVLLRADEQIQAVVFPQTDVRDQEIGTERVQFGLRLLEARRASRGVSRVREESDGGVEPDRIVID